MTKEARVERRKAYMKKWYADNRERNREKFRLWCRTNAEHRRAYKLNWSRTHKDSVKLTFSKYFSKNREAVRAMGRRYSSRPEVRVRRKAYAKKYHPAHYSKNKVRLIAQTKAYAQSHPEVRRLCSVNYRINNPEKYRALNRAGNARRKARIRGADVSCKQVGPLIRRWHFQRNFICYWCNRKFPTKQLTVDHIIPISKDGKHSAENVCPSCRSCNSSKKDKLQTDSHYRGQMLLC